MRFVDGWIVPFMFMFLCLCFSSPCSYKLRAHVLESVQGMLRFWLCFGSDTAQVSYLSYRYENSMVIYIYMLEGGGIFCS